jgi:hypothetical protein
VRDAADLADLLRMGRLTHAWIAPGATRELRELVRHRAKLTALPSHCKAEVRAVLAKCGIQVSFGAPGGTRTPNLLIRSQMLYPLSYGRSPRRPAGPTTP